MRVVFHPIQEIVANETRLFALESLIRGPVNTSLEDPTVLFEYARQKRAELLVDRACLTTVFQALGELSFDYPWLINVQTATIGRDQDFPEFLFNLAEVNRIPTRRLIVELTSQDPPHDRAVFQKTLEQLRQRGVRIALSGFGGQHSNHLLLLRSMPDYLKLDRCLVHRCGTDRQRWIVLDAIARMAESLGIKVIALGVEDESDCKAVKDAGISLMQGYHFSPVLSAAEAQQLRPRTPWTTAMVF